MTEPTDIKALPKEQLTTWLGKLNEYKIIAPVQRDKYDR